MYFSDFPRGQEMSPRGVRYYVKPRPASRIAPNESYGRHMYVSAFKDARCENAGRYIQVYVVEWWCWHDDALNAVVAAAALLVCTTNHIKATLFPR